MAALETAVFGVLSFICKGRLCLWQNSSNAIIKIEIERYTFFFYGLSTKLSVQGGESKTTNSEKQR